MAVNEETIAVFHTSDRQSRDFEFDYVFNPDKGQADVYEESSSVISSLMDGYNVCIMAYGQTGALCQ